jgi:hypothetical protein
MYDTLLLNKTSYIFWLIYSHHEADRKNKKESLQLQEGFEISNLTNMLIYTWWAGIAQSVRRLATGLRGGDRIPVGAIFSAPVQAGSRTHPAFYAMGTGSFPGVKWPGRGSDQPPHIAPR